MPNTPRERLELIPARRRGLILERIRLRGSVAIQELSKDLSVSASTVRRDLETLTGGGHLERTHGGALIPRSALATFESESDVAARSAMMEKTAIGQEAARRLINGGSVVVDAGSTANAAALALVGRNIALTVITNSLAVAQICGGVAAVRIIVVGGTLRPGSSTLWGDPGRSFLGSVSADLCLLGAHAISGLLVSESSIEVAEIKRALMRAARRTILMADSNKFQQRSFCTVCAVTEISEIITDDGIAPEPLSILRDAGVVVTLVRPGEA